MKQTLFLLLAISLTACGTTAYNPQYVISQAEEVPAPNQATPLP